MVIALPAGHPLAAEPTVDLADAGRGVVDRRLPPLPRPPARADRPRDFGPRIAYETDNFIAVLSMVAERVGVALLPSLAVGSAVRTHGVVIRPTANRDHRTVNLVGAAGADQVPAIATTAAALLALDAAEWSLAEVRT